MEPHHIEIVALEVQFCPVAEFNLPSPFTYELKSYAKTAQLEIAERRKNATIVITTTMPFRAGVLSADGSLKLRCITVMASRIDTIDRQASKA